MRPMASFSQSVCISVALGCNFEIPVGIKPIPKTVQAACNMRLSIRKMDQDIPESV